MPQETKNIIQLKESTSGPNFYPETHKDAIVGKEDYTYLGQVVSPGGGGGGTTGTKGLSVSPRQSVIVGKCIPVHPRKGKKYYFADGLIKVNRGQDIAFYSYAPESAQPIVFKSSSQKYPVDMGLLYPRGVSLFSPIIVEITREWIFDTFDLSECTIYYVNGSYNSDTESPNLKIINGHIINISAPNIETRGMWGHGLQTYDIEFLLKYDKLRAIGYKYTSLKGNWGPILSCTIILPIWKRNKLERYKANNWLNKKETGYVPKTPGWVDINGDSVSRRNNAKYSGRVYLYSVRRRRVSTAYLIVHFLYGRGKTPHRIGCLFCKEKMYIR